MSASHIQQDLVRQHFPWDSEKDEMLEKVRGQLGFAHWKENRPTSTLLLLQAQTPVAEGNFIPCPLPAALSGELVIITQQGHSIIS